MDNNKESIIDWVRRVGLLKLVFYRLIAPVWNFTIDRLCDTIEGLVWACRKVGI